MMSLNKAESLKEPIGGKNQYQIPTTSGSGDCRTHSAIPSGKDDGEPSGVEWIVCA